MDRWAGSVSAIHATQLQVVSRALQFSVLHLVGRVTLEQREEHQRYQFNSDATKYAAIMSYKWCL